MAQTALSAADIGVFNRMLGLSPRSWVYINERDDWDGDGDGDGSEMEMGWRWIWDGGGDGDGDGMEMEMEIETSTCTREGVAISDVIYGGDGDGGGADEAQGFRREA